MRALSSFAASSLRGTGALGVAGNGFVRPLHPFGRVEPAVAEGDQAAGGLGDGDGAGVFGVSRGGDVGGEAVGEGEGFEGCGGGVAGGGPQGWCPTAMTMLRGKRLCRMPKVVSSSRAMAINALSGQMPASSQTNRRCLATLGVAM